MTVGVCAYTRVYLYMTFWSSVGIVSNFSSIIPGVFFQVGHLHSFPPYMTVFLSTSFYIVKHDIAFLQLR